MNEFVFSPNDLSRSFDMANRIAPTAKGAAWDKAAGMLFEIETDGTARVISTNLEVSSNMVFKCLSMTNPIEEKIAWRMSSIILSSFVKKLQDEIRVTHDETNSVLIFRSGESKLTVPLIPSGDYPVLSQPPTDSPPVDGASLSELASRVMWACDQTNRGGSVLTGLHADGDYIVGCRHEGMSLLEAPLDIKEPITFQARELIGLLKGYDNVKISADDGRIFLWLSDTDWVSANLIIEKYPKFKSLRRENHYGTVRVDRSLISECMDRMSIVAAADRGDIPKVCLTITKDNLHLKMEIRDVGESEESIPVIGGPDEPFSIYFSLGLITEAIRNSDGSHFDFSFGIDDEPSGGSGMSSCLISDETGWEATLMPRRA